jgi:cation diffusion facilitator family transporter
MKDKSQNMNNMECIDCESAHTSKEKEKKAVALSSVFAAIFLTGFKFVVGITTGSLGILSEALHSFLDLLAAVITFVSVRLSDKPADERHNFGHGKIENLSALIQTVLLLVTCFWIFYEAIKRLITNDFHIEVTIWSYIVVVSSIIIDISRSRALLRVAKKHNSQALEADALHFSTDIWSSTAVLIGLLCVDIFDFPGADPIAALIVACIVLYVCYRLGRKAIDVLLDKAPAQTVQSVVEVLKEHAEIERFHHLKVRTAGADTFISFNIHLKANTDFVTVHQFCDHLEKDIMQKIPSAQVYIHAEPDE